MTLATPEAGRMPGLRVRARGLDALRGLAVALMALDHVLIVTGHEHHPLRYTVTRAAMPLFFVVSGHLFRRLSVRQLDALALGLVLPLLVPWLDAPNVLVWYAAGCVWLRVLRGRSWALAAGVGFALCGMANGYAWGVWPGSYNPLALIALMSLGALLPRAAFTPANRLPAWLAGLGRYPLSVYAGHVLVLEAGRVSLGG